MRGDPREREFAFWIACAIDEATRGALRTGERGFLDRYRDRAALAAWVEGWPGIAFIFLSAAIVAAAKWSYL